MVEALQGKVEWRFLLPTARRLDGRLAEMGIPCNALPMVKLGRALKRLAAYVPMLVIDGIRLRRLLGRQEIQTIIANDYYNLLPMVVRLLGWRGRVVTIVRLLPAHQQPVLNRLWIAAMRWSSDVIVAVSRAVKDQIPANCNAQLLYFPVGRSFEDAPFVEPPTTIGVRFLYLANYIHGKGQEYAIRAFAEVLASYPDARLKFVGGDMGLAKNADFRAALQSESQALKLAHAVEFCGATGDVIRTIQAADVLLNFSESESFSHTCVEGALLGRPLIATRSGGPEEIVEEGMTGILVGLRNVEQMVSAMQRLATSSEERRSMGKQALDRARMRFGSTGFAAKLLPLLSSAS